jgi:lysozyme
MDRLAASDPELVASVKLGEGLCLKAYPDPLTRASPWTIGYGHTGPDVGPGTVCTAEKAEAWLASDLTDAMTALDQKETWWRTLPLDAQRVLAELCFNMGLGHLQGFHRFLNALQAHNWIVASAELANSLWASQVGARSVRLEQRLLDIPKVAA